MKKTLAALIVLALVGGFSWLLQLVYGAGITNMNNFVPWGLYIVGFMIFTGVAAGSLMLAGAAWLFDSLAGYRPYTKIITFLGVFCGLVGAGLFIFVDLGNPQRGIYMLLSPNLSSPQVWDAGILSLYGLTGSLLMYKLWMVSQGKAVAADMKNISRLAIGAGLLVIVTSFAFVLLVSSPAWNNPGEPVSFLFAAVIAALAVLMLALSHLQKVAYCAVPEPLVSRMGYVASLLLALELIFLVGEACIGFYAPYGEEAETVFWQLTGKGAAFYWAEILAILMGCMALARSKVKAGSWLALLAVFLIKYNLLQSQQLNPLLPFAGPSVYNPPALGVYIPSLPEVGTALGIVAVACIMGIIGLVKFKSFFAPREEV